MKTFTLAILSGLGLGIVFALFILLFGGWGVLMCLAGLIWWCTLKG